MERAKFNLYDYSKHYEINSDQAFYIFRIIL